MNKTYLTIFVSVLALLITSCSSNSDSDQPTAETTTAPPPVAVVEPEVVAEPELEERVAVSGLLPPTDSDQRVDTVVKGRDDPFRIITVEPKIYETEEEIPPPVAPPEVLEPVEETTVDPGPDTSLAEKVVVTGVVELDDVVNVILKAPRENYSRYVQVGQYIADGQVLLKGIEVTDRNVTLIILEQSGVEVRKTVGSDSETEDI